MPSTSHFAAFARIIGSASLPPSRPIRPAATTPMGRIYTTNITPDPDTGIGTWSEEDFERALRQGVAKDGHNLYPAMPYPSYAKVRDDDVKALYAYFMKGVAPVRQANRPAVGVLFYRTHWMSGNLAFIDACVRELEARGANALPVFTASLKAETTPPDGMTSGRWPAALSLFVADGRPLYRHVAQRLAEWAAPHRGDSGYSMVGAVVGATYPAELAELRQALPGVPFLVPGLPSLLRPITGARRSSGGRPSSSASSARISSRSRPASSNSRSAAASRIFFSSSSIYARR